MKRKTTDDKHAGPSTWTRWRLCGSQGEVGHADGLKGLRREITVPSCTETVQEDGDDEALGPEWTGQLFEGDGSNGLGDGQDFLDPTRWDASFERGDWIAEVFPEPEPVSTTEAPESVSEPELQPAPQPLPEPAPVLTASERLCGVLQRALSSYFHAQSFPELRDGTLDWPALLSTAGERPARQVQKYLKTAHELKHLNQPGHSELVTAFTLLFLAGGKPRGKALEGIDIKGLISREDIEALDDTSRDYLRSK